MKDLIQDEKIMCASFGTINQVHKTTKVAKPKPNKIFEYFTSVAIKFALELFLTPSSPSREAMWFVYM